MQIQLSEHFTYKKLLRFVTPSIAMMIFMSIYSVVDGLFISNFVGKVPFAAINLVWPLIMGLSAFGFMIGTGGCALVSKTLGEGKPHLARRYFSMLVCAVIIGGAVLTALSLIFLRPIMLLFGATENMLEYCMTYGRIMLSFQTAAMLQGMFQSFFSVAEKPKLGLIMTVIAGLSNILLDALFVAVFKFGIAGAAFATVISQCVGGIVPLIYFLKPNSSTLRLTKPTFSIRAMLKVCLNGSSELVTNISSSVVATLYNLQLMHFIGEDGVAAYGVLMYVNFIFLAIFFGYSIGSAPIIGYHYGAENHSELKNLFKKSLVFIGISGILLTGAAELLAKTLSKIFVGYDAELYALTLRGFRLYSLSFLICGFNIFGSSFFTALNNGTVSAAISFMRTLVFQVIIILTLPVLLGVDGIWLSVSAAEILALIVTTIFFITMRKKYKYI